MGAGAGPGARPPGGRKDLKSGPGWGMVGRSGGAAAGLAQLAEQLICNQQVVSSSLTVGSTSKSPKMAVFSKKTNVFGPFLCLHRGGHGRA